MAQRVRIIVTGLWHGQTCQNVMHFNDSSASFSGPGCHAQFLISWINRWKVLVGAAFVFTQTAVQNLNDLTLAPTVTPLSIPGTGSDNFHTPSPIALVIKISTGVGGRHGRGRIYVPGMASGGITNGIYDAGFLGSVAPTMTGLRNDFVTGGTFLTIGVGARTGGVVTVVHSATQLDFRPIPGIQRRRNIAVGI